MAKVAPNKRSPEPVKLCVQKMSSQFYFAFNYFSFAIIFISTFALILRAVCIKNTCKGYQNVRIYELDTIRRFC